MDTTKKLLFVYNPNAGTGMLKNKISDVVDIFVKAGYEVTIYPTQCYHDAYNKISGDIESYDLVVCGGGDGTLDEVVTGMYKKQKRIPIGYIPAGSTNDFAHSLHISRNILEAAHAAVNGIEFPCDIGTFNDSVFVYVAAFGLFTDVSYGTNQDLKNLLGHAAYILEGAKQLFNVPSYHMKITHDGEAIEGDFMLGMVTNSRSVGGFSGIISSDVVYDDGVFEVTLFKTPKNLIELNNMLAALTVKQLNSDNIITFRSASVSFVTEREIPWTLDGEFGGDHNNVLVLNQKQALSIMIDPKNKNNLSAEKN